MRWSIRYRLLAPLMLLLLGVVAVSAWSAVAAARQAERRIASQVRSVTHTLSGASIALTPRILEQMKGLSGADYLLLDAEANRISTLKSSRIDLSSAVLHMPAEENGAAELGLPVEIDGSHYRCRRLPQRNGGNLFILYPELSLNEAVREAVKPFFFFGLFGGVLAVALMYLIGQRLVGRIQYLERRTREIAAGDFSPMPLPGQNDELRDLSQSVNEMAERLAEFQDTARMTEQWRLLGQLSSGLAHQLRNSITGARLAVQLHAEECSLADREALQVALRQLNLTEVNLRRFLDLSKDRSTHRERAALACIIDEVVALLRPQARHIGGILRWQKPEQPFEVIGDADELRDAFVNVVGNAIEAAGPEGVVEIQISLRGEAGSKIGVEVIDTGPGPPPAIAARLFEPFITGKPEGVGLGLAVARHAVELHGGSVSWERHDERTTFRIMLPRMHVT